MTPEQEAWTQERAILQAKIAELEEALHHISNLTYCTYCGATFALDSEGVQITHHINTCPQHPLSKLRRDHDCLALHAQGLEAAVEDLQHQLASARSTNIALRMGSRP